MEITFKGLNQLLFAAAAILLMGACSKDEIDNDGKQTNYEIGKEYVTRMSEGDKVLEECIDVVMDLGEKDNPALFLVNKKHVKLRKNGDKEELVDVKPGREDAKGFFRSLTLEELDNFIAFYAKAKGLVAEGETINKETQRKAYSLLHAFFQESDIDQALFIYAVNENEDNLRKIEETIRRGANNADFIEEYNCELRDQLTTAAITDDRVRIVENDPDMEPNFYCEKQPLEVVIFQADILVPRESLDYHQYHPDQQAVTYYSEDRLYSCTEQYHFYHGASGAALSDIRLHFEQYSGVREEATTSKKWYYSYMGRTWIDDKTCVWGQTLRAYQIRCSYKQWGWYTNGLSDNVQAETFYRFNIKYGDLVCFRKRAFMEIAYKGYDGVQLLEYKDKLDE